MLDIMSGEFYLCVESSQGFPVKRAGVGIGKGRACPFRREHSGRMVQPFSSNRWILPIVGLPALFITTVTQ